MSLLLDVAIDRLVILAPLLDVETSADDNRLVHTRSNDLLFRQRRLGPMARCALLRHVARGPFFIIVHFSRHGSFASHTLRELRGAFELSLPLEHGLEILEMSSSVVVGEVARIVLMLE